MLLWFDGFDSTESKPSSAYFVTNPYPNPIAGRFGGYALGLNNTTVELPIAMSGSTLIVGFALFVPSGENQGVATLLTLGDGTNLSISTNTGAFTLSAGDIYSVSTPGNPAYLGSWNYVELMVTFGQGTAGSYSVHINGAAVAALTASGVESSGVDSVNSVTLSSSPTIYVDDFYVCDGSGSTANGFLGNQKVVLSMPSAEGRVDEFTPEGASPNWDCVSEIPNDGDTTYVQSQTPGQTDCYEVAIVSSQTEPTGAIAGVKVTAVARIDNAGSRSLSIGVGNGTTEEYGAPVGISSSYVSYPSMFEQNPFTSAPWEPGDLPSLQAAIQVAS